MSFNKRFDSSNTSVHAGVVIERAEDVLTFTLDNSQHANEVTGPMFDAMLAELMIRRLRHEEEIAGLLKARESYCKCTRLGIESWD